MAGEYSPAKHAHNIDDVCGWGVLPGRMEHQGGKAREYSLAQPLGSSKTWLGSTPRPSHLGQARYGWGVFPGPAGEYSPAEWNTKGARLGSTPMYGCCMFQALIFARGMYNYASRKNRFAHMLRRNKLIRRATPNVHVCSLHRSSKHLVTSLIVHAIVSPSTWHRSSEYLVTSLIVHAIVSPSTWHRSSEYLVMSLIVHAIVSPST